MSANSAVVSLSLAMVHESQINLRYVRVQRKVHDMKFAFLLVFLFDFDKYDYWCQVTILVLRCNLSIWSNRASPGWESVTLFIILVCTCMYVLVYSIHIIWTNYFKFTIYTESQCKSIGTDIHSHCKIFQTGCTCTRDISSSRLSDSTMQAVFSQPQQIVAKLHRYIVFLWDAIYKQTSFP